MFEIRQDIPDPDLLLALPVEELAGRLLFAIKQRITRPGEQGMVILTTALNEVAQDRGLPASYGPAYPVERREQVALALVEAWTWLESQGLLVPAPNSNGQNGWRVPSRRAAQITSQQDFNVYRLASVLPRESVHPSIRDRVWLAFARREYDTAVFTAMKAVEVAVRDASGWGPEKYGVSLVREAFRDNGPLCDMLQQPAEREALANLFAGAIGSYKNPHSHRHVDIEDPLETAEIVALASHLLRIVDDRKGRTTRAP